MLRVDINRNLCGKPKEYLMAIKLCEKLVKLGVYEFNFNTDKSLPATMNMFVKYDGGGLVALNICPPNSCDTCPKKCGEKKSNGGYNVGDGTKERDKKDGVDESNQISIEDL